MKIVQKNKIALNYNYLTVTQHRHRRRLRRFGCLRQTAHNAADKYKGNRTRESLLLLPCT